MAQSVQPGHRSLAARRPGGFAASQCRRALRPIPGIAVPARATAGRATTTAAVLAEDGKAWLGLGSIEYAFIERTKADLDIEGEPAGPALQKLNAILKTWDEQRQATTVKN